MLVKLLLVPLGLIVLSLPAGAQVVLNEFMVFNDGSLLDEAGDADPWLELYNAGDAPVALEGLVLRNQVGETWMLPAGTTLQPGRMQIVWVDEEPDEGAFHTSFGLRFTGDTLELLATDGSTVLDAQSYEQQLVGISTGRLADGGEPWVSLLEPTPAGRNDLDEGASLRYDARDPTLHDIKHFVTGTPQIGGTFTFEFRQGPPGEWVIWYLSTTPLHLQLASGKSVLLVEFQYPFIILPMDQLGAASVTVDVGNYPALVGLTIYSQVFDIVTTNYYQGSNAAAFTITDGD